MRSANEFMSFLSSMNLLGAGIAAISACAPATPRAESTHTALECSSVAGDMAHQLKLSIFDKNVVGFDYNSTNTKTGNDCGISATRLPNEVNSPEHSNWTQQSNGLTTVDVYIEPQTGSHRIEMGRVEIGREVTGYRLTVIPAANTHLCAPGASLAPTVILTVGKKDCSLVNSTNQ